MTLHSRSPLRLAGLVVLTAGVGSSLAGCSRDDRESRPAQATAVAPADRAARAASWARALIDSAGRTAANGDTAAARAMLARANALASSDPSLVYQVAFAQERIGDVGPAARGYRRYLSIAPTGHDVELARERLAGIVSGVAPRTSLAAAGEIVPPTPTTPAAPVLGSTARPAPARAVAARQPVALASASRPAASSRRVGATRAARVNVATTTRGRAPIPAARTTIARPVDVASTTAPALPAAPVTTAPEPQTEQGGTMTPPAPTATRVADLTPSTEIPVIDASSAGTLPKVHYGRWSRMQYWFVTKVASLGGVGGVVVGAIIGNVPGALAVGLASGAAGGLAKVHEEKVDSSRMIKARIVASSRRIYRDSAAGEVMLLPLDSMRTGAPSAGPDSVARRNP